ncbi:hypothetical protein [Pseudomonas sp. BMS12]|uniref:hypothetical protein n=1 Tax=Pseudomonas sp. BMS12 TaxID=1796033 RepID=UPI00083A9E43|nr:hypothetical protein [Pseudomonas sp. BMS12]
MSVHQWARQELERCMQQGQERGLDETMCLRALLSQVVELNRQGRDAADLAQELAFLADNLDPERDYAFMRP